MLEHTLVWAQMSDWLQYLKWYCDLVADADHGGSPYALIRRALDPPLLYIDWMAFRKEKKEFFSFGRLWKMYDKVGSLGLDWRLGILVPLSNRPKEVMWTKLWKERT